MLARALDAAARWIARAGGTRAVARVEAAELPAPRYAVYTLDSLEQSLRRFEEHFGLQTERFLDDYDRGRVPDAIPRHSANVWAGLAREQARLRSTQPESPALFSDAVAL